MAKPKEIVELYPFWGSHDLVIDDKKRLFLWGRLSQAELSLKTPFMFASAIHRTRSIQIHNLNHFFPVKNTENIAPHFEKIAFDKQARLVLPEKFMAVLSGYQKNKSLPVKVIGRGKYLEVVAAQDWKPETMFIPDPYEGRVKRRPLAPPSNRLIDLFKFAGTYEFKIDDKKRILIPAGLRDANKNISDILLVSATGTRSIYALPYNFTLGLTREQIESMAPHSNWIRADRQNRVLLPDSQLQALGDPDLPALLIAVGRGKYFQFMSKDEWQKTRKQEQKNFTDALTRLEREI